MIHQPTLVLERLSLRIGDRTLMLRSPARLEAGRLYLVVGPSGMGKSSIARALLGLLPVGGGVAVSGNVRLEDARDANITQPVLSGEDYSERAQGLMGWLPQLGAQGFIDDLSVQQNALLFSRLPHADAQPQLEKLAVKLHIWPLPSVMARASGGEKMRVAALRALMPRDRDTQRPLLLIADEPTVGLDHRAAGELVELLVQEARSTRTLTMVITHDPSHFVGTTGLASPDHAPGHAPGHVPGRDGIDIIECQIDEAGSVSPLGVVATFKSLLPEEPKGAARFLPRDVALLEQLGRVGLSPLAFLRGLIQMPRRMLGPLTRDVLATALNPGTHAFVMLAAVMVAVTIGVFAFHLMPERELIEPLVLPDVLKGFGVALHLVLIPMFSALFACAKLGASQSARLSASVRSGLLESLALGRVRLESYALVPAVLGQVLALCIASILAGFCGLVAGALVFQAGDTAMALDEVVSFMWAGMDYYPGWQGWMLAKVLLSGFAGGVVAALFGLSPTVSERDVALQVRRTLLWTMVAVLVIQCALIMSELA